MENSGGRIFGYPPRKTSIQILETRNPIQGRTDPCWLPFSPTKHDGHMVSYEYLIYL
jgi:hypothetical protein